MPEKFEVLRGALSLSDGQDVARFIEELNGRIGMPAGLAAMGVPAELFAKTAEAAVLDHSTASNPRPVEQADFARILADAL